MTIGRRPHDLPIIGTRPHDGRPRGFKQVIPAAIAPPAAVSPRVPKPGVQMRFRTDGWNWADQDRASQTDESLRSMNYSEEEIASIRATPPAQVIHGGFIGT